MPEYDFLKDEDLVKKSLEGEDNAFRELVDRYQSPLVNYLYRFTGIRELSEEIVQETFIAVFQNIENFHLEASFRAWIYAIATNRALNMLRRKSPTCNPIALENAVGNRDPIQEVSEQERSIAVQKALGSLPEKQRAIFILRFIKVFPTKKSLWLWDAL